MKNNLCKVALLCMGFMMTLRCAGQQLTSFQEADLVIGQPNFQSVLPNFNSTITYGPSASAISSKGMLAVAEQLGGSVKIWYKIPVRNGQPADVEVGNPGFTETNNGPTRAYAESFDGVAWSPDGNKLIATCGTQNRILIWNSVPQTNGQPADVVLGQPDFISTNKGSGSTTFDYPCGILVSPSGKMLVADYFNNRVLIWNSIPDTNTAPAEIVIGQPNFNSKNGGNQPQKLYRPRGIYMAPDGRLLISCASHNVFIYDSIPESNQEAATVVIGHDEFGLSTPGISDSMLCNPVATAVLPDGSLAIAEYTNNRVLLFDAVPVKNGAHAKAVLGQPNFTSNYGFAPSGSPDRKNMSEVYGLSTDLNGRLFVNGRNMNRVMVFGKLPGDSADLSVSIASSEKTLCKLSNLLIQIDVQNAGPDTARQVTVAAALPFGSIFEKVYASAGSYEPHSGYWTIPFIAPNSSASLSIDGSIDSGCLAKKLILFTSVISSSAVDPDQSDNAASLQITILPATVPDDPVVSDVSACNNAPVLLAAASSDTVYWYDGIDAMNPVAMGPFYNTNPITKDITYYAESRNACPGNSRMPINVMVSMPYFKEETVFVCSGSGYLLPDGTLMTDIVTDIIHVSKMSTIHGCDSIINTTIKVNRSYDLAETVSICNGETYSFPDGTVLENISSPVTHISNLVAVTGCDSIITTSLNVTAVNASVIKDGTLLKAQQEGASYQWIDRTRGDDPLMGETSQYFSAVREGKYAVVVSENGCSVTSEVYTILLQGVDDRMNNHQISVYPNPAVDFITVTVPFTGKDIQARILTLNGQVLVDHTFMLSESVIHLEVKDLKAGIYLVHLKSGKEEALVKMIKE